MAQEKPDTPEKQLLRLIEDPKAKGAAAKSRTVKRQGLSLFSPGSLKGRLSFFKKGFGRWLKGLSLRQLDIKAISRILGLCNFVLVFYFVVSFSDSMIELKKLPDIKFSIKEDAKAEAIPVTSLLKAESFYLEKVRQRNIFKMGVIEEEEFIDEPDFVLTSTISAAVEATQHLRLVGISWSGDPDAMIEDTRALRTFFVKKGQTIGEVKVETILRDRVILSYEGDEVELR